MLHGIRCIQSGCFGPCCIKSNAFTQDAFVLTAWTPLNTIGIHCTKMHWILCIPWHYMESTAFNRDALGHSALTPLHSIGRHWASLHGLHCIQSGSIAPQCLESSHSLRLHGIHCIQSGCFGPCCIKSTAFNHASWNPLHSIMLHKIHCIQ